MELMLLVGVWALAFGQISLTNSSKMKGNRARIFGLLVIVAAAYGFPQLNTLFGHLLPNAVAKHEAFRSAYGLLVGAIGIHTVNYLMNTVYPKLRIPTVNVKIRSRKAA